MDDFGPDGTQAPPPPRLFPDPLAGLVTGGATPPPAFPDALTGLVTGGQPVRPAAGSPVDVPAPIDPQVYAEPPRRAVARRAPRRPHGPLQPAQAPLPHPQPTRFTQPVPFAMRQIEPARQQPAQERKSGKGGLAGCLLVLAVLSGLLFNVLREIVGAVAELFR
ncbi:hypothetical protein ACQPZF_01735 [Actinosynnema sp. CS-041913]|uniref:hypothetical protein n=1 Tax=Actinosynnema sp. CS-041913 TaxID=3239917 RepID=UPI003D8C053D